MTHGIAADAAMPARGLIIGIGNELRRDDGIGMRFIQAAALPGFDVLCVSGIYPELADSLCAYTMAVFADAALDGAPVAFGRIFPDGSSLPLCHGLTPQGVLALSEALYHVQPEAYLLSIRGYDFGYGPGLSPQAGDNLQQALELIKQWSGNLLPK